MSVEEDEDLPSILIVDNNKTSKKGEQKDVCLPSADILATQRAREEECLEELQKLSQFETLHYACKNEPVKQPSDSSIAALEASLTEAVKALYVEQQVQYTVLAPAPIALLNSLLGAPILQPYNLSLIKCSAFLLESKDELLISNSFNQIILDIKQCLKRWNLSEMLLPDEDSVVLCLWLCATCIWSGPRLYGTNTVLSELLKHIPPVVVETVAQALISVLQEPHTLIEASDALCGPTIAQRCLANHLLVAALSTVAPNSSNTLLTPPALSLTVVCRKLQCIWRDLNAKERHAALLVVGRVAVYMEPEPDGLDALRNLLALALQAPDQPLRQALDNLRVLVTASRLQVLFAAKNIHKKE